MNGANGPNNPYLCTMAYSDTNFNCPQNADPNTIVEAIDNSFTSSFPRNR